MIAPAFSWTGFYIGGNLGGAWGHGSITDSLFGLNFSNGNSNNGCSFLGPSRGAITNSATSFSALKRTSTGLRTITIRATELLARLAAISGDTVQATSNQSMDIDRGGAVGFAVDHWLFYGKAGGGWVGNSGFTVTDVTRAISVTGTNGSTNSGWLVGAGTEWAFARNWTVKLEYDYLGLSNQTVTLATGPLVGDTFTTGSRNIQMVKGGINFLFNAGAF